MKPILFSLLFLLLVPKLSNAQTFNNHKMYVSENDKVIYLDSLHKSALASDYTFIRVIKDYKLDKNNYTFLEYYKSGVLYLQGHSKTKNVNNSKDGEATYYYENGNKKSVTNYAKGRVNGENFEWYENGAKKLEGEFIEDEKKKTSQHKINQFWDENGVQKVVDGNGFYEDKGENESSKGEIKNGFPEGVWEGSFNKLKKRYRESYKDKKLISGESWDGNNKSYKYTEVEIRPEPKDGITVFYKYIAKNYRMPDMPKGTKGKVFITFIVDKKGKIVEPKVLKDMGYGTGEEALRILSDYDGFVPGELRGQKVSCSYSLPITIQSTN